MVVSWIFLCASSGLLLLGSSFIGWRLWKKRRWNLLRRRARSIRMNQEQLAEAVKARREMEALISSPGWKSLVKIAEANWKGRENQILLKPTENPLAQEYLKGEVQGIKLFAQYPETIVEASKAIIDSTKSEEEIE